MLIRTSEITLHHQFAVANNDDGVDVGIGPLSNELVEAAKALGIHPDVGRRCQRPAVTDICGHPAVLCVLRLQGRSTQRLAQADARGGDLGAVLTGAALGPVFSSCSPLYAYVVVTVLPASLGEGLVLLGAYVVGLCATLLAIALLGQRLVRRLGWAADPHGWVQRIG